MPIAKFQLPDGRIGKFEVPDGTSPEQAQGLIESHLADNPVDAPAAPAMPPEQRPFLDRMGDSLDARRAQMHDIEGRDINPLNKAGQIGLGVGQGVIADAMGNGITSAVNNAPAMGQALLGIPSQVTQGGIDVARKAMGNVQMPQWAQDVGNKFGEWEKENPNAATYLGGMGNLASNVANVSPAGGLVAPMKQLPADAANIASDVRAGMAQALKNRAEKAYVPTADSLSQEVNKAYNYSRNAGVQLNDAGVKELMSVVDNQAVKSDLAKSVGNKNIETMLGRIKEALQNGNGLPLDDYIEFEKEINKRLSGTDAVNSLGEYSDVGMSLNSLKHDMRNAVTKMANSSLGGPKEAVDAYRQGLQLSVKKHQLDDLETVMRRARNKGAKNTIHNEMSKIDIAGAQGYTPEQQALIAQMAKKSKISDYATGAYAKGAAGLVGYATGGLGGAVAGYTAPFIAEHLLDRAAISNLNKLKKSIGANAKFVEPIPVNPTAVTQPNAALVDAMKKLKGK